MSNSAVHPGGPVRLRFAVVLILEGGVRVGECLLGAAGFAGYGAGPGQSFLEQGADAAGGCGGDGGAGVRGEFDGAAPVGGLVGEEGEGVAEEAGVSGLLREGTAFPVEAVGLGTAARVEPCPPCLLGLLGKEDEQAGAGGLGETGSA